MFTALGNVLDMVLGFCKSALQVEWHLSQHFSTIINILTDSSIQPYEPNCPFITSLTLVLGGTSFLQPISNREMYGFSNLHCRITALQQAKARQFEEMSLISGSTV